MINPITITRLAHALRRFKLTWLEYAILNAVSRSPNAKADICRKLSYKHASLTNPLKRLEKAQLIYIGPATDNVQKIVHITPDGTRLLQDIADSI